MEVWIPIKNYESQYEVSNFGNVRSLDRYVVNNGMPSLVKGRLLTKKDNGIGYLQVTLYKDSKSKNFYIHRLVAEYFVEGNSDLEVNHIDGDKTNNHFKNLEWSTRKGNFKHAVNESLISRDDKGKFI